MCRRSCRESWKVDGVDGHFEGRPSNSSGLSPSFARIYPPTAVTRGATYVERRQEYSKVNDNPPARQVSPELRCKLATARSATEIRRIAARDSLDRYCSIFTLPLRRFFRVPESFPLALRNRHQVRPIRRREHSRELFDARHSHELKNAECRVGGAVEKLLTVN